LSPELAQALSVSKPSSRGMSQRLLCVIEFPFPVNNVTGSSVAYRGTERCCEES
jgi:hypothetical protein